MVATPASIPPVMLTDDSRRRWHHSAIIVVREAQDIYKVSFQDIQKAAITHLIKQHFFEELPKIFKDMAANLQLEIQKNEPFDAESYRESRILYDMAKPFFDRIGKIEISSTILGEKEAHLHKNLVEFLTTLKEYLGYLEGKFLQLDKPKFNSRIFSHVTESELWSIRNKNRPYLL
jgi:hypothetical protein